MIPIHNILVPTDFSEPAEAALEYAKTLAQEFNSRIHLLHVVSEPYVYPWGTDLPTIPIADLLTQSEEAASERLTQLAQMTPALAGRVTVDTEVGTPVERILDYIGGHEIDLVVIGTHGRGMVGHLLLGSVAERVVRRSPVPVLTVHHTPKAAEVKAVRVEATAVN
jgi:nucleotide-binding universal stress UspA family protein